MKIDIKSIVNTLSDGTDEIKSTDKALDIREVFGVVSEEPKETKESEQEETAEETVDAQVKAEESASEDEVTSGEPSDEPPAKEDEEQESDERPAEPSAEDERPAEPSTEDERPAGPSAEDERPAEPSAEDERPAPTSFQKQKEKLLAWGRSYGWLTGIAASFLLLMTFMVVYTTMTPREIYATINGEEFTFVTEEHTVGDFLESEKIAFCEEDHLSVPPETFIQEGVAFELVHATDFTVTADGKTKHYKSLDNTVQQALDDVGVKVGELDIVTPKPDALLEKDTSIVVQRVVVETEVVEEDVPFKTVEKDDVTMKEGKSKVVREGRNGKAQVTYEVVYIDGKESSRKEIARKTITKARKQVIANGTMVSYNGKNYSKKLVVKAYAYTGGGTTAMGTRARVGEIAVDPSVIPLGTNVYIEGVGARRAEDTGGNIKGNTIDIYMNTQSECINWGMRYVTIYIE